MKGTLRYLSVVSSAKSENLYTCFLAAKDRGQSKMGSRWLANGNSATTRAGKGQRPANRFAGRLVGRRSIHHRAYFFLGSCGATTGDAVFTSNEDGADTVTMGFLPSQPATRPRKPRPTAAKRTFFIGCKYPLIKRYLGRDLPVRRIA